MPCDVTDIAALRRRMAQAAEAHGPITVLVNNAANDQRHPIEGYTVEEWDRSQAVNLRPHFFTAQAALPGMQRGRRRRDRQLLVDLLHDGQRRATGPTSPPRPASPA